MEARRAETLLRLRALARQPARAPSRGNAKTSLWPHGFEGKPRLAIFPGMAQRNPYRWIVVESFIPDDTSGRHGLVHIRPVAGQGFPTDLFVECSKNPSSNYAVGTRFRIRAKLTDKEGGGEFLYSYFGWDNSPTTRL
jgi:hypothetical protein